MHEIIFPLVGVAAATVILSVAVVMAGRLRIERQRTLQRMLERGMAADELVRAAGLVAPRDLDRRRGLLLIATGVAWSLATFLIGGRAWTLGAVPVVIGCAFLLFWVLDGRRR